MSDARAALVVDPSWIYGYPVVVAEDPEAHKAIGFSAGPAAEAALTWEELLAAPLAKPPNRRQQARQDALAARDAAQRAELLSALGPAEWKVARVARAALLAGLDPLTAMALGGWQSISMLKRYAIMDTVPLRAGVAKLAAAASAAPSGKLLAFDGR